MSKPLVFLDNCTWNFLYAKQVDLLAEQGDEYSFTVSARGFLEIPRLDHPDESVRLIGLYAHEQLNRLAAQPANRFGFGSLGEDAPLGTAGFGSLEPDGTVTGGGYFGTLEGQTFRDDPTLHKKIGGLSGVKKTNSGLLKNETDVDYGEWSLDFPLITDNLRDFKNAKYLINIKDWQHGPFGDFVTSELRRLSFPIHTA